MRKFSHLLYSFIILTLPVAIHAKDPDAGTLVEKRRNIVKVFDVKNPDLLTVDNQFGQVKVNLWSKKEIRVEIIITANAPSDERAAQYLNAVQIDEKRVKNQIALTTSIDKSQFGRNGWNNKRGEKNFIQIDYTVFMPKENALVVRNQFGDTDIPSFMAPLTVNAQYGTFSADYLENMDNHIDIRYGSVKIGKMDGGKLDCQYSNLQLDLAKKIMLSNKFGPMSIGDITNLDADIDYSGAKIGIMRGTGKIRLNYSPNFRINELTNSSENVNVEANYSSVVLPAEANTFNVTVTYGSFSYPTDVNFSMQPAQSSQKTKQYQGKVGAGSGTKITVNAKYGNVRLKD